MFCALIRVRVPPYLGTSELAEVVFAGVVDVAGATVVVGARHVDVAAGPPHAARVKAAAIKPAVRYSFFRKSSSCQCSPTHSFHSPGVPQSLGDRDVLFLVLLFPPQESSSKNFARYYYYPSIVSARIEAARGFLETQRKRGEWLTPLRPNRQSPFVQPIGRSVSTRIPLTSSDPGQSTPTLPSCLPSNSLPRTRSGSSSARATTPYMWDSSGREWHTLGQGRIS